MFRNIGDMHEINMGIEEHETKEKIPCDSYWTLAVNRNKLEVEETLSSLLF